MAASTPAAVRNRSRRYDERSPRAKDSVNQAQLAEIQRARIVGGMFDVCAQQGFSNISVKHVVTRAGVSRRTFYELFADGDECFLAAFEHALDCAAARVLPAYEAADGWRLSIRAGLAALLCFLDDEPVLGRFLFSGRHRDSQILARRRNEAIAALTDAVRLGEAQAKGRVAQSQLVAEGVVGGVLSVIGSRLAEPDCGPLCDLVNPLMGMIVLPYLGAAAARREQEAPMPTPAESVGRERPSGGPTPVAGNPLADLPMRLTYRTALVLSCVAENPGASNRAIGNSAGIGDPGQISKLLSRLERLGLTVNRGNGHALRGEPNAWLLTPRGVEVERSVRVTRPDRNEAA